jgi:hypothetical protein
MAGAGAGGAVLQPAVTLAGAESRHAQAVVTCHAADLKRALTQCGAQPLP